MWRTVIPILKDKMLSIGWLLIAASALLYAVPLLFHFDSGTYMGFFLAHYVAAVVFFFVGLFYRSWKQEEHKPHYRVQQLLLFFISAFALNREMEIFSVSTTWFSVVLVIVCTCFVVSAFYTALPAWAKSFLFFSYGLSSVLFFYLSICLLPIYAIAIPGLLLLGFSIHTFVPVLFLIRTVQLALFQATSRKHWISFSTGVLCTVLVCTAYSIQWNGKVNEVNEVYTNAMSNGNDDLPLWVQLAQNIDQDEMTEKLLKAGNVYTVPSWGENLLWSVPSFRLLDEQKLHDPLVVIASLFSGNVMISNEDRVKILESQYNARHQALERLWSGDDLRTQQVATSVRVWPDMHLAYTEKLITVRNAASINKWPRQQEAIYTMHMPEGAVVTSLSLWINGKEEKGILTTKEKANTAYRTIVGYERRDPSVVHWQEGNTVSVRVFPVDNGGSRTFKIGFTAPLRRQGAQLVYDNIWFQGPDASAANETIRVELTGNKNNLVKEASLRSEDNKVFTRSGKYRHHWELNFIDKGFQAHQFSFNGNTYKIEAYTPQRVAQNITDVYLDINRQWTGEELNKVWSLVKGKNVWVYNNGMERLTEENMDVVLHQMQRKQFSLFPFYSVKNRETALVISKSGNYTPNLADLQETGLTKKLNNTANLSKIKLFHIGTEFSPYLRSLKERRFFQFECGDLKLLQQLLANRLFVADLETDDAVIVHSAEAFISKQPGEAASNAPDHLMRLFAYNHIMQGLGKKDSLAIDSTSLVKEAQEAYVVSPVSSLVVLETQADYDRFDIKDGANSLKNASMKNNGAVPEPAEWALIILVAAVLLFSFYKWKTI